MVIIQDLLLDTNISNRFLLIRAKQGDADSRYLKCKIAVNQTEQSIPSSDACTLNVVNPNGIEMSFVGTVNNDNTVTVPLDSSMLAVVGNCVCSVSIYEGGTIRLTTQAFIVTVEKAENADGYITVYTATTALSAGSYYININGTPYHFTTTSQVPANGTIAFNSTLTKAYTYNASGTAIQSNIAITNTTTGTQLAYGATTSILVQLLSVIGNNNDYIAGSAKQLLSSQYNVNKTPYTKRICPYGDRVSEEIVGCTVAWNQLLQNAWYQSFANSHNNKSGLTITKNADFSVHIQGTTSAQFKNYTDCTADYINGHQYLIIADKSEDVQVFNGYGGTYADSIVTYNNTAQTRLNHLYVQIASGKTINTDLYISIVDLTECFGSSVANRLKAMGANGVEWCKNWIKNADQLYSAKTLQSTKTSAKKSTSLSGTVTTYPLQEIELKGILALDADNNIVADGDIYKSDGTIIRNYTKRAYQQGDENLANAITDGTNTVVKLTTPITESASPYQAIQACEKGGIEEFVCSTNAPVGHNSRYYRNLRQAVENIPEAPTSNGTYQLRCVVSGGVATYSWVSALAMGNPFSNAPENPEESEGEET